ncbi:MAG TPA: glycosyltransferase family 2 protein [Terriglobia bacterium]|nr:glycosyltransferase family 2 protein [Terriglobia bacterium]
MEPRISVVVNTLNEEKSLPSALRSVREWADEIVVVDMHSRDRTADIAREFGARVVLHEGPGFNYAPREFAVKQASYDWIMVLDADELAPLALGRELRNIAKSGEADVVVLPRENYLLGARMSHTGWGPSEDGQTRFFRRGSVIASSIAHQDFMPTPGARVLKLSYNGRNAIVHFNYFDAAQFLEKLNRYTSIEARQARERGERVTPLRALARSAREFYARFISSRGYRDGWRGFYLSCFMAFYRLATCAKLEELEKAGPRESVVAEYRRAAERVLSEYKELREQGTKN